MANPESTFVIGNMNDFRLWGNTIASQRQRNCSLLMEQLLKTNVSLSKYSQNIQHLFVNFMAMKPNSSTWRPDKTSWLPADHKLRIFANIDYQILIDGTEEQIMQMMARYYLKAIETHAQRLDFDHKKFYQDVHRLFAAQGWLTSAQ